MLVAGVWIGTGALIIGGEPGVGLLMGAVAVALAVLAVFCRLLQPVAYEVHPDRLSIVRRRSALHYPGRPRDARPRPFEGRDLRILGTGGLYGYTGRFRLADIGPTPTYVTDGRAGMLVRVAERPILVSPADQAGFAAAAGGIDA